MAFKDYKVLMVWNIHDGDTVQLLVSEGLDDVALPKIRLLNVFAAELSSAGGAAARQAVVDWFAAHREPLTLYTYLTRNGNEQSTLGRWVGDIHGNTSGESLCAAMGLWLQQHPESAGGIGSG